MNDGLSPYPEYKNSGVSWLGEIPVHWEVRRAKQLFQSKKEINRERAHKNILSLTLRGVVNNDPDNPEGLVPKDYASYQFFQKNDLVFKLIDLENLRTSRVGLVHEDGIMSPAYVRLSSHHDGIQRFFFHQYYDLWLRGIYNQLGAGVRATLGASDLLNLSILVPPPDEQSAIVRYLDHANQRIERYIRGKRKLIALLNEQKQAIIHRAVTRGLDANVRCKPSGVAWLGDVPEHWEIKRIKFLLREVDDRSTTGKETLLSLRKNHGLVSHDEHFGRPGQAATLVGYKKVRPGQVVLNRLQANNGLVFASEVFGLVSPDFAVFDSIADVDLFYLTALFRTPMMKYKFRIESKGLGTGSSGFLRLYSDRFVEIKVALPPRNEQLEIMGQLRFLLKDLEDAIARAEREIELIREYRTRLIADVVTGKVDVRAAAQQLPATEIVETETPSEIENEQVAEETESE